MPQINHDIYFYNLKAKNPLFFIALYFSPKKYRQKITAILGLYTEWIGLFQRISEPLAIQMRLTWWQEQFLQTDISANAPLEIKLLKEYEIHKLLTAIEHEYLHCDTSYKGKSTAILFGLIAEITQYPEYYSNAMAYGLYYGLSKYHTTDNPIPLPYPKNKLIFKLRFLRIPIILQEKQNFFILWICLIKNFLI